MLQKLKSLFAGRATPHAEALYRATVAKARDAAFYETLGAADTVEGRYDLLTLHVHMLLTRLRGEGALAEALSQDIFDVMMKDMDASLREIGVGDLIVGKRMQQLAAAFYGRGERYKTAFEALEADTPDLKPLQDAVKNNILPDAPDDASVEAAAAYVARQLAALRAQPAARLMNGVVRFDEPVLEQATDAEAEGAGEETADDG